VAASRKRLPRAFALATTALSISLLAGCLTDEKTSPSAKAPTPQEQARAADAIPAAPETPAQPVIAAVAAGAASANAPRTAKGFAVPVPLPDPRRVAAAHTNGMLAVHAALQERYRAGVATAVDTKIDSPRVVKQVLKDIRYDDPAALQIAWISGYAQIAAANPVYEKGVLETAREIGPEELLKILASDPGFVRDIHGAGLATADVTKAFQANDLRLKTAGENLINAAYSFQKRKWGALEHETKRDYASLEQPGIADRLGPFASTLLRELAPISSANAYTPYTMTVILTVAAQEVIVQNDEKLLDKVADFRPNRALTSCLNWARLNLNQCLAAAHFPSEEAWCTGTHGAEDVRVCWNRALPVQSYASLAE